MIQQKDIRNFCIIAHIDHGKSTLADRLLEVTSTVAKRDMKDQMLDQMDLERERGITIKLQPVRMQTKIDNKEYLLNLIDTPGHVDFTYEVSRSLACCEGALLVVDSTQGIEAQTLANAYMAIEHNLTLIPVINKIDLPNSDREKTAKELVDAFGFKMEDMIYASGKTGEGMEDILRAVVNRVPAPTGKKEDPLQALVFDSVFDAHKGVITYIRVFNGRLSGKEKLSFKATGTEIEPIEIGYFNPKLVKSSSIECGEVGYIMTGLRDVSKARVGDTVVLQKMREQTSGLPGYKQVKPMVYATLFTTSGDDYPELREAMEKLKLSDSALEFEPVNIPGVGFGFRTGFLGLLHMEIVSERLYREYDLSVIVTTPTVAYEVVLSSGERKIVSNPAEYPDPSRIASTLEPWMRVDVIVPSAYIGSVLEIVSSRRGISKNIKYMGEDRVEMHFEMPLYNIIVNFYDQLKSATSGYASLNYDFLEMRPENLVKVDILVAGEKLEPLSVILHRTEAESMGREMILRLKELIPRHQFEVTLQASIGGKIIARESISALRKDVTGYLYGGDVTRKMKLLKKQKLGKKKMKKIGKVDIPQEAFLAVLK